MGKYGYTFDEETRQELAKAVIAYSNDQSSRAALNAIIMKIQQPLIDKLERIEDVLNG